MWILPSLNRPIQCAEVIQRLKKHGCSTLGILFVNTDENSDIDKYNNIILPDGWKIIISDKNIGMCEAVNRVFSMYPNERFYGLITDDEFICTDNWDKLLVDAAGRWNVSHGNNNWQSHRRIHGFTTIGGELMRTVGYFTPPGLWHWYSDDVWEVIAFSLGLRQFLPDVKIENKHWMLNNIPKDRTYELAESRNVQDQEIFLRWKEREFSKIELIIRSKIDEEIKDKIRVYQI